ATVSLTVWPMNDPTILTVPGPQTIAEDTSLTFSSANGNAITIVDLDQPRLLVDLLVHDAILTLPYTAGLEFYPGSGNNRSEITFYADDPAEANAALNGLVFTPNLNYNGWVYLDIMVRDTTFVSGYPNDTYGYVPITVTPVNDPPVAVNDSYSWYEDMPLTVYGMGVLGNASDPEWKPLSAVLVSGPAHGGVTLNSNGTFTYTPSPNYYGPDSFVYRAVDSGGLSSAPATVSLTIWPMDDPIQVTAP